MFCRYCGASLPNGAVFCSACGKKVEQSQPNPQFNANSAPQQNEGNQTPYSAGYQTTYDNGNQTPYTGTEQMPYGGTAQNPYGGTAQNPYGGETPNPYGTNQPGLYGEAGQPPYITGEQSPYGNPYPPINPISNPPMPMKWYKFLIYFSLFAGAVLNFISAISLLTGSTYGDMADAVYSTFPALQGVDLLYGAYALFLTVFSIVTRQKLAHFKANGPKMVTALYIMSCVGSLIYSFMVVGIIGDASAITSSLVSQVAVSICMAVYNHHYFKARAHLFH